MATSDLRIWAGPGEPAFTHQNPYGPIVGNTWLPGGPYGIDTSANSIVTPWLGCLQPEADPAGAGTAVGRVTRRCLWDRHERQFHRQHLVARGSLLAKLRAPGKP